jgi:GxxExxY protein
VNRGNTEGERESGPVAAYIAIDIPPEWNRKTERVIGLAMTVHRELGPGPLEKLYEDALCYELSLAGFVVERQKVVRPRYKGIELSEMRLDLVVDGFLILELKSVSSVPDAHLAQLVSQLRAGNLPLGLLINFFNQRLKDHIYRRINPAACPKRHQVSHSVLSEFPPSPLCTGPNA